MEKLEHSLSRPIPVDPTDESNRSYAILCELGNCSVQRLVDGRILVQYEGGQVAIVRLGTVAPMCEAHDYQTDACALIAGIYASLVESSLQAPRVTEGQAQEALGHSSRGLSTTMPA